MAANRLEDIIVVDTGEKHVREHNNKQQQLKTRSKSQQSQSQDKEINVQGSSIASSRQDRRDKATKRSHYVSQAWSVTSSLPLIHPQRQRLWLNNMLAVLSAVEEKQKLVLHRSPSPITHRQSF